jgi:hypothetical protein
MEKFMLVIREDLKRLSQYSEKARVADLQAMLEWTKSIAESGNYIDSAPLAATGRYVKKTDVLSDGPFIESKEGIAGYYIILAESLNQAVSIAQTSPLVMKGEQAIEVRPMLM